MSQPIMKLFGVVFLAAFMFAGAGAANAFEITQDIPDADQTACMDVEGSQTTGGTAVQAYPCTGSFNEQWSDVAGTLQGLGTTASGANCANPGNTPVLVLGACSANATWMIDGGSILDFDLAQCLDSQSQYGSGAQIALKLCSTAASQLWTMRDIVFTQAIPNSDQNACVDVQGAAIANNTPVNAYPCTFGANERWTFVNGGENTWGQLRGIGTTKSQSTCLGTTGTSQEVEPVVLQTCTANNPAQQWTIAAATTANGEETGLRICNGNGGAGGCLDSNGKYGNAQLVTTGTIGAPVPSQLWTMR